MKAGFLSKLCRAATALPTRCRQLSSYPKHELVGMPSLSPTMEAGTVASWGKKVGDKCSPGESVAEIETDKASMAFEAQDEFFIAKLLVEAGVEVPVGSPMMVTVEDESFVAAFADYVIASSAAPAAKAAVVPPPAAPVAVAPVVAAPKPVAAPVVVAPVAVAAPAPVVAAPAPVAAAAPVSFIPSTMTDLYSVKWSTGAVAKSAIAGKLTKDQQVYLSKYGRSGQKPLVA